MNPNTPPKRLFFVAGERSGDAHGAHLIAALRRRDPSIQCEGLGGIMMAEAGMRLLHDLASHAIMGFAEVVKHFPAIRKVWRDTVAHIEEKRPDALVLIDYPGFNLRLAQHAEKLGIPVIYYISPQIWAWKKKRIHTIARCVRKMLVIFPFEEALYHKAGVDCAFVGHPLIDRVAECPANQASVVVGLLPGSRAQEIARIMPVMAETARRLHARHPELRFMTPCVDAARAAQIRALAGALPLEIEVGGMESVLRQARFCMVASGTATLETALYNVPMVILYRTSSITYALARLLVRGLTHIGIVNILAGKEIVPEFVQYRATPENVMPAALELIENSPARERMLADFAELRAHLGAGGASENAAREILACLGWKE